ncbi:MAG: peroxiredoxin [Moraxellaceae bacterium]|nr:MAG: peroxiredoxin [Moraxellaceae bacterium]
MTIKVGDPIPQVTVKTFGEKGPQDITTEELFSNKKVVLFAVPGAFTPGCSLTHLPGYVVNADKIKAKGVDSIACMSVNDAFVMGAWGKAQNADELIMLADGNAELAEALGLTMNAKGFGMGIRSKRFAMIVDNGVVSHLNVEPAGGIGVSAAETILELL